MSSVEQFEDGSNLGETQTTFVLQWIVVSINDDDGFGGHGAATVKQRPVGSDENFNRPAVPYSCRSDPPDPLLGFLVSRFLALVFLNCVHHTLSTAFLPWCRSSLPKTTLKRENVCLERSRSSLCYNTCMRRVQERSIKVFWFSYPSLNRGVQKV